MPSIFDSLGEAITNPVYSIAAFVAVALLVTACTFANQATFTIDSPATSEHLLNDIERYFAQLGLRPDQKVDFEYPKKRKERSYSLGLRQGPIPLHTTYNLVVLRLEEAGILYIDWIEISNTKRVPKPEYFDVTHGKIANDLRSRFGVEVKFSFVEAK